ncbi:MAG: HXXEE domain-containing protein [Rhodospirillales bacterium]|nr:HXXEE domain-containing protein [Rhodospirillales bacterium]
MYSFDYVWPYMGLGAALLLALLLATDLLRSNRGGSRWRDLVWLTWLGTLAYLVHQFEEHGVDANGAEYAFRDFLCGFFGFADPKACPLPPSVITAVNVAAVWLLGPAAALLGRRWPLIALSFFSVPSVNLVAHVASAVAEGAYNPGVFTAIVLFLPLSLWAFYVALAHYRLGWRAVIATVAAGIVLHGILMASLLAFLAGRIGVVVLDAIQVINPVLAPLIVMLLGRRRDMIATPSQAPALGDADGRGL